MKQIETTIIRNDRISSDFHELVVAWPDDAGVPLPGQFLTIRVGKDSVPLLRRPFAFSGYDQKRGEARVIFQRRGRATQLLSSMVAGEKLDCIGPLGTPFPAITKDRKALCIAGGIGLGPVLFLAESLSQAGDAFTFVFGARMASMLPVGESFTGLHPQICTDDGSAGFRGTTADFLATLDSGKVRDSAIYCCGPMPMLRACHEFSLRQGVECWISVEQVMACGVGACMGCVVKVKKEPGYARACKEGPVFRSDEVVWE